MGNRRSRLQCLMKWKALSKRFGKPEKAKEAKFDSWRFKSGNAAYDKMLPGDKYEIVRQIREMGVLEEERISWRAVCKRWPDEMWQPHHRKVALMRMKNLVEGQGPMSFPELLERLAAYFESRYPEELGKRLVRERKEKRVKGAKKKDAEANKLSKETVDEDDDEDVVMGEGEVEAQAQAQAQAAAQAAAAAMVEAGQLKREDEDGEVDDEGVGGVRESVEVDSVLGARDVGDDDDDDEDEESSDSE